MYYNLCLQNELREITGDESTPPEPVEEAAPEASSPEENEAGGSEEIVKLLQERLQMYKLAVAKASAVNETGRARRFGRGVKTLEGLLTSASSGRSIDQTDIPPALPPSATGEKPQAAAPKEDSDVPEPTPSTPPEIPTEEPEAPAQDAENPVPEPAKSPSIDQESLDLLKKRQHEYKVAAMIWKKSGNIEEALSNVKVLAH